MRTLLSYLAEKSFTGKEEELKEYTIGIEAFAKPSHYDPQQDPSVRVQASKLRHKLEEYYLREGTASPYRIELPRGHFALKFHPAAAADSLCLQVEKLAAGIRKWRLIAAAFAVVALLSLFLPVPWRTAPQPEAPPPAAMQPWTPDLDLIWSPFLHSSRSVLISLGTPLFTKFSSGLFRNPTINDETKRAGSEEIRRLQEHLGSPFAVPAYPYAGVGEAIGAFQLARLFQDRAKSFNLEKSSSITWSQIQHHNVIFLGPPKFNLQLADMPNQGGFVIQGGTIQNFHPRPGEQAAYSSTWAPNQTEILEDYALVSRFQGLHGGGEIMALGAGSTAATWAAAEYVTQPLYASELVSKVGLSAGQRLPQGYQVVIRVRFRKEVPVLMNYVTHRVLEQQPDPEDPQQAAPRKATQ